VKIPGIGLIVSNVRGPEVPLYMAGAQLVNYSPISIPIDGLGLNVTSFSYNGTMWICAVSCREMMPDPAFFARCLREAFEELKAAAARHAAAAAEVLTVAAKAPRAAKAARRVAPRKRAARRRAGARA
jgi:diacylglycerol O-acyltransferase